MRYLSAWIIALFLLVPSTANSAKILLLPSDDSSAYAETESILREKLAAYAPETISLSKLGRLGLPVASDTRLIIAIGTKALQTSLEMHNKIPVLAILVTQKSVRQFVSTAAGSRQVSAIYIDQPFSRQLELIRIVTPRAQRIGVLFSAESEPELAELKRSAQAKKFTLVAEKVNSGDELAASLTKVLSEADVILAIPDPSIFNSATIQNILFSAYRARKPLICFSPYYVRAGAVAAVYSTPKQLAYQAAETARLLMTNGVLAQPQYARDFSVTTNPTAAQSLDLAIDDEKTIADKLVNRYEGS